MSSGKSFSVALLHQGHNGWIAGVTYLQNVIRIILSLPREERIDINLLLKNTEDIFLYSGLKGQMPPVHRYAYTGKQKPEEKLFAVVQHLLKGQCPESLEGIVRRVGARVLFPCQVSPGKKFPVPWIGWIPDFQHKHLPEFFPEDEMKRRDMRYRKLVDEAHHLVVSSEDTFRDLMRWFPVDTKKVSIFRHVAIPGNWWYEGNPEECAARYGLPDKFLMFPGQFWVHKNHAKLFEAIRLLKERGVSDIALVCTGHIEDFRRPQYFAQLQDFIARHQLESNIYILGCIERTEQVQLMRRAAAIVQPSLFEGGGLLVEEVRALGKTVYVSDIPVHREQDPPTGVFFDPQNPNQLADLIAADWPRLQPGPDLEAERGAREHTGVRNQQVGRDFIKILWAVAGQSK